MTPLDAEGAAVPGRAHEAGEEQPSGQEARWSWDALVVGRLTSLVRKLRERRLEANVEAWRRRRYIHRRLPSPCRFTAGGEAVLVHHRQTLFDNFALYQCFHEEQYRIPSSPVGPPVHRLLVERHHRDLLARGAVPLVVDCGAHIGAGTAWLAASYPGSHCVAVEPAEENVAVLRRNTAGLRAEVVHAAVGAADGEAVLRAGTGSMDYAVARAGAQGAQEGTREGAGRTVPVVSLRTVLGRGAAARSVPFILKMDVEGAEKDLFGEADWDLLDRFPVIIVEGHDFMLPGRATTSGLFRFHGARERDFLFGGENVFSISVARLSAPVELPAAVEIPAPIVV